MKIDETVVEEIVPEPSKSDTKTEAPAGDAKSEETEEQAEEKVDEPTKEGEQLDEKEDGEPKEKQFKTYVKPHILDVKINERLHNVRLLNDEQVKAAKKRIKELEKRDEDLRLKHEAKNFLETNIYALRTWLQEDENVDYTTESERETWIEKCNKELEWFDDEGYNAARAEFNSRGKALDKMWSLFKDRKIEHEKRKELVPQVLELLKKMKDDLPGHLSSKPWITE